MLVKIICTDEQTTETLKKFFDVKSFEDTDIDFLFVTEETSDAEIKNFVSGTDWLIVVVDVENVSLAGKISKFVKKIATVTALILCPTAKDSRIAELEKIFDNKAVLPENKISESNLEKNEAVCKAINALILFNDNSLTSILDGLNFPDVEPIEKISAIKIICTNKQATETLKKFFSGKYINGIYTDFLSVTEETSDEEIKKFISDPFWLFVVADVKNLNLAKKFETMADCLVTNIFFCPTADDAKISELEKNFGTIIILPEDKISETTFEKNELVHEIITSSVNLIQDVFSEQTAMVGLDFYDIEVLMKNSGRVYVGIGEGFGENAPLKAIKNALKFPLLMDTKKAKGFLVDFTGGYDDISMIEVNEAITFLSENAHEDAEILFQANIDDNVNNFIKAIVFATNFEK